MGPCLVQPRRRALAFSPMDMAMFALSSSAERATQMAAVPQPMPPGNR